MMDEEAYVISKELGIIKLKDVYIGIHVLSFDEKTKERIYVKVLSKNISKSKCLNITLSNGANIITNNKILTYDEKYFYKKPNIKDVCIIPNNQDINYNFNNDLCKIAWFIGAHLGDGTAGIIKNRNRLRFRILGDEENVLQHYIRIDTFCYKFI